MTGPEHYLAAEQLLADAVSTEDTGRRADLIAAAGVHARLAALAHTVASGITWQAPKGSEIVSGWAAAVHHSS